MSLSHHAHAQWPGFVEQGTTLGVNGFSFGGDNPEAGDTNENYYDGDFGDVDGDGRIDRALISRYGLLLNTGDGVMIPLARGLNEFRFGDADTIGNDVTQWADVDGDGDLDNLQGGNGEPFTLQRNLKGRFSIQFKHGRSALNIVNTDLEGDGDVDLVVAHAYCGQVDNCGCGLVNCGGPLDFSLWENDGSGNFTEVSVARGLDYATAKVGGAASGDVDGDGDFDLVLGYGVGDGVMVAFNDGAGFFTTVLMNIPPPASGFAEGTNLGDLDDDGDLDLIIARQTANGGIAHVVALNDGNGTFVDASSTMLDAAGFVGDLNGGNGKVFDMDYDGDLDFVALRRGGSSEDKHVQVFLNDGTGKLVYSDMYSQIFPPPSPAFGSDMDVADVNGDGVYDLWVGLPGEPVRILINQYQPVTSTAADTPRNFTVEQQGAQGVTLSWQAPTFAATARYYKVYRTPASGLEPKDRRLIKYVGLSRFQDEAFSAPITRWTTTADLGDPSVTLDGNTETITFTDDTALPGVSYFYSVSHVGTENSESARTLELEGAVPAAGGADTTAPQIDVISPTIDDWSAYPRIVVHFADGGSGVDPASIRVSFDKSIGGRASGDDLSDLAYRRDEGALILPLTPPFDLPEGELATMTVDVADLDGNAGSTTAQMFVSVVSPAPPSATLAIDPPGGEAPLDVSFSADGSDDADGKVVAWEWYFGDGTTANGRNVVKRFEYGGSYDITLIVRDNEGGVGLAEETVSFDGELPPGEGGAGGSSSSGAGGAGGMGGGSPGGGAAATPGDTDSGCGCRVGAQRSAAPLSVFAGVWMVAILIARRRRRGRARR